MRNTVAKTEIISLLNNSSNALSHIEIQNALNGLCDRVTIYRVLDRLIDEGLLHKIINVDGVVRYASCNKSCTHKHSHNHVHFSCTSCKKVTCLETVEPSFLMPKNYTVTQVNFTVSGICPSCS